MPCCGNLFWLQHTRSDFSPGVFNSYLNGQVALFAYLLCEHSFPLNIFFIFFLDMTETTADLIVMMALGKPS